MFLFANPSSNSGWIWSLDLIQKATKTNFIRVQRSHSLGQQFLRSNEALYQIWSTIKKHSVSISLEKSNVSMSSSALQKTHWGHLIFWRYYFKRCFLHKSSGGLQTIVGRPLQSSHIYDSLSYHMEVVLFIGRSKTFLWKNSEK